MPSTQLSKLIYYLDEKNFDGALKIISEFPQLDMTMCRFSWEKNI